MIKEIRVNPDGSCTIVYDRMFAIMFDFETLLLLPSNHKAFADMIYREALDIISDKKKCVGMIMEYLKSNHQRDILYDLGAS